MFSIIAFLCNTMSFILAINYSEKKVCGTWKIKNCWYEKKLKKTRKNCWHGKQQVKAVWSLSACPSCTQPWWWSGGPVPFSWAPEGGHLPALTPVALLPSPCLQHASWTALTMATAIHSPNAVSVTPFGWRISSRCSWGMETATVVSFLLWRCQLVRHWLWLWVEWVAVGVSKADEQAGRRTLCICCLQRT